jgi:hypothetical protein
LQRLHLSGGFQRGPQPAFGTRPCLQGIVCYTSAEGIGDGRQPDVLLMLSAAWMQIVFQQQRAHARTIPAAEVYRSPSHHLRSIGFTPCEKLCYNGHNHT